nr:MAG TPA: hypothetical protein [Caudoviricetes sp.]
MFPESKIILTIFPIFVTELQAVLPVPSASE